LIGSQIPQQRSSTLYERERENRLNGTSGVKFRKGLDRIVDQAFSFLDEEANIQRPTSNIERLNSEDF
jgi:hypothetical protein